MRSTINSIYYYSTTPIMLFQGPSSSEKKDESPPLPPELAHLDKNLVEKIQSDIVHKDQNATKFADIAGLEFAKKCVQELICWPICRPDLFTGLRSLPKGLLLFGSPGIDSIRTVLFQDIRFHNMETLLF